MRRYYSSFMNYDHIQHSKVATLKYTVVLSCLKTQADV